MSFESTKAPVYLRASLPASCALVLFAACPVICVDGDGGTDSATTSTSTSGTTGTATAADTTAATDTPGTTDGVGGTVCAPGSAEPCYDGPDGTEGIGACVAGMRTCSADGTTWGACEGQVLPGVEDCETPLDEDCDDATPPCASSIATCAEQFGGGTAESVAVDSAGNIVLTGYFSNTIDFGGGPLNSAGEGPDVFIAKLDATCGHVWSRHFGDEAPQYGYAVASDGAGDVLFGGRMEGSADYGGGILVGAPLGGAFLVKLDASGAHVWSKHFGAGTTSGVAVDEVGDVALTGWFNGSIDFGGAMHMSAGNQDIFLVKLGAGGEHVWSMQFGDQTPQAGTAVAFDAAGALATTGAFFGTIDLAGATHVNPGGNNDGYLAKRSSSGDHVASRSFTDLVSVHEVEVAHDVAFAPNGDMLVAGRFTGATDLGAGVVASVGSSDTFIARYSSSGDYLWARRFGTELETHPRAIAVDASGNALVTGSLTGSADFGGGLLTSAGATVEDVFVLKLDAAGNHIWSERFGDGSRQIGHDIAVDGNGHVVVVGSMAGTVDFGLGLLAGNGAFVVRFAL